MSGYRIKAARVAEEFAARLNEILPPGAGRLPYVVTQEQVTY